jgi:hypothetical protein
MSGPRFKTRTPGSLSAQITVTLFLSCAVLRAEILQHWKTNLVSTSAGLNYVIYANNRYVAYGDISDNGAIFTSEDGQNWVLPLDGFSSHSLGYGLGLCYTGGRFFAIAGIGTSAISDDGITWDSFSFPAPAGAFALSHLGLAYGGGIYVAVSSLMEGFGDGRCIARSTDGKNWIRVTNGIPSYTTFGDVLYRPGRFVAFGSGASSGFIYRSTNGTNWSQNPLSPLLCPTNPISSENGFFFAANGAGTNLISVDGEFWDSVPTGLTNAIGKILFSHGVFLARAGSYLASSTDGTNWIQYANPLPGTSIYGDQQPDIATDGTRLVRVVTKPDIFPDGYVYSSDELVEPRILGALPPQIAVSGLVGRTCGVSYANELPTVGAPSWQPLTNFQLSTIPTIIVDSTATNASQRYYRSVLLP